MAEGKLIVFSAPSGSGKTTIVRYLLAQEELRLAQERFRFGAASSIEVTDAQTNLAQAEQDLINAVYNFHRTLASLEALVGRPLR